MARVMPLHAQLETQLVEYRAYERQAKADGVIDAREQSELASRSRRINTLAARLVRTMRFVATCISGERGMDSPKAREVWDLRQLEIADESLPTAA